MSASQPSRKLGRTATWGTVDSASKTRGLAATVGQTRTLQRHADALRSAFREGILEDVIKGGITDDVGLQKLFDRWVEVNPVHHRAALALAIQDVQIRLDSPL